MARRNNKDPEKLRMELARAYMVVFGSEEGQRVLADLQSRYGQSSITSDFNPNRTMVLEGCRLVLLSIIDQVEEGRRYAGGQSAATIVTSASAEREPAIDTSEPETERERPEFRFGSA